MFCRNNSLPFRVINKARTHQSAWENAQLVCVRHRDHGIVMGLGCRGGSFWVHRGEHWSSSVLQHKKLMQWYRLVVNKIPPTIDALFATSLQVVRSHCATCLESVWWQRDHGKTTGIVMQPHYSGSSTPIRIGRFRLSTFSGVFFRDATTPTTPITAVQFGTLPQKSTVNCRRRVWYIAAVQLGKMPPYSLVHFRRKFWPQCRVHKIWISLLCIWLSVPMWSGCTAT